MNTIIAIFRRDVGKLLSRPTACIIMIGLIIIPSLYAWFNIAANWDPYSNTKNIAIGVANNDTGTVLSGASLNVGDKVVQELRANDAMDWTFVSEQEALERTSGYAPGWRRVGPASRPRPRPMRRARICLSGSGPPMRSTRSPAFWWTRRNGCHGTRSGNCPTWLTTSGSRFPATG